MDSAIQRLKELLDLKEVASITLPGLILAAVLATIFWPPKPINIIPVVETSAFPDDIEYSALIDPVRNHQIKHQNIENCTIGEHQMVENQNLQLDKAMMRNQQALLEDELGKLSACIEIQSLSEGEEKTQNELLEQRLKFLEAERAAEAEKLIHLEDDDTPGANEANLRIAALDKSIANAQNEILKNEQAGRVRDVEVSRLKRYEKTIQDRLADPGRLRPEKPLDEYLNGLSNHIVAFLSLAAACGVILKALSSPFTELWHRLFFKERKYVQ